MDIHDKERETMSLNDLLELYSSKSNQALDNDCSSKSNSLGGTRVHINSVTT